MTLSGLELSVQMAEKTMTVQGMCESLYQTMSTMTTSIDIAEKVVEESSEEIEGLDALSAYIEKVLSRVKVRVEHFGHFCDNSRNIENFNGT